MNWPVENWPVPMVYGGCMGCLEGVFCADFKSLPAESFSPEQHNMALILLLATFRFAFMALRAHMI